MIDVVNLTKKFGDLLVLDDISTTIEEGERVVVIGPSGGGKSTFLRCLNCLEDPTAGKIFFDGVDLADVKVDINVHRRHIGMIFQQFNLFNNKTVLENITLAPLYIKTKEDESFEENYLINRFFAIKMCQSLGGGEMLDKYLTMRVHFLCPFVLIIILY